MIFRTFLSRLPITIFFVWCPISWAAQTITVAVVPQVSSQEIYLAWSHVLKEISKRTGIELKLKLYDSIPSFEMGLLKGEPDIAYMNPYHALMANKSQGYIPIVRDGAKGLSGILVVRKDSKITQIDQLNGATLAFPAPNAFGASLYMRALLTREAKIEFSTLYVKTHPNVFRNVLLGKAEAGGAVMRTFEDESPEVQEKLRILYATPMVSSHPIGVHPRVPVQVRDALQQALLSMGKDVAGQSLLVKVLISTPTKAALQDYAALEKLNLEEFVTESGI